MAKEMVVDVVNCVNPISTALPIRRHLVIHIHLRVCILVPSACSTADGSVALFIAQAAQELVARRDAWLNPPGLSEADLKKRTLTNLYNQRPTWLDLAHKKLDAAVFAAYGWPADLSDEEILERLLALNLQRAEVQR
jgi:hypothetical protein